MSIANEITRINNAKTALKESIEGKGVIVPSGTTLDGYAALVSSIPTGGGGTLPDNLSDATFNEWGILQTAVVKNDVTTIAADAYRQSNLQSITIPSPVTINGSAFRDAKQLTSVTFGGSVALSNMAFYACTRLNSVILPEGSTLGSTSIFFLCSAMTFADLPSSLPSIPASTFGRCNSLSTIVIRATTPPTLANTNAFDNDFFKSGGKGGTIYVPSASINSYKSAENWATVYGWGATTFNAIEGSIYE